MMSGHKRRPVDGVKAMKIHVEMDMTPEEARTLMGLPDVTGVHELMLAEMKKRVKAAMDTSDPEAMLKAWMPMGAAGFEQFQRFLWDSAQRAANGAKKTAPKG
jgi:hypothetical protein